jgi:hypothetical protein
MRDSHLDLWILKKRPSASLKFSGKRRQHAGRTNAAGCLDPPAPAPFSGNFYNSPNRRFWLGRSSQGRIASGGPAGPFSAPRSARVARAQVEATTPLNCSREISATNGAAGGPREYFWIAFSSWQPGNVINTCFSKMLKRLWSVLSNRFGQCRGLRKIVEKSGSYDISPLPRRFVC